MPARRGAGRQSRRRSLYHLQCAAESDIVGLPAISSWITGQSAKTVAADTAQAVPRRARGVH
jgi:hypothetical protein